MSNQILPVPVTELITSPIGREAIQHYELLPGGKVALKAYQDMRGKWTIGYGMTVYPDGTKVKGGDVIDLPRAHADFDLLLVKFERKVRDRIKIRLLQREFDAAVMFCYNAGTGYRDTHEKYHEFNLWENINNRMPELEYYWHTLAVTSGGMPAPGLVRRRKTEFHMFQTGTINYFE